MMNDYIIYPLDQFNYFESSLFYQYLGSESWSIDFRKYINPAYTDSSNGIEYIYQSILNGFKIDDALGIQLDIIGRFVGLTRPTLSDIGVVGYFGYDGSPNAPFDFGEFADGRTSTVDSLVNDDKYRFFIKLKIGKNIWDGTRLSLKNILSMSLDVDQIEIETTGNAEFTITFSGGTITQEDVNALLLLDLIPTPQGVFLDSVTVV